MKAFSNQVVLAPREDLEDNWGGLIRVSKATGLIEPRPVYGEVVDVGKGDQLHPDIPDLRKGDLVVWDLSKIGPPVIENGRTVLLVSFNALLARILNPKTEQESYQALLDVVLTEDAPLAMQRSISSLLALPGAVLRDGMQEQSSSASGSPITTVFERVVSVGRGITFAGRNTCARCKCELQRTEVPECRPGDLVVFNPMHSVDWRRRGRNLRFTPFSEIRGLADE